ncbi:hypothetical protein JAAARDRAFT_28816 [Jaapia argillacea MUCL 33604]|uniref:Uncharacterized protein n=1 Tax=Jaapia argillacea MUCL 33604 TaxID=933084 RepID=A0A067QDN8_9AGAM|nr:hypothetical protein JAAARDRAFT_28816 [Jaapia argillacea MUCL 33604]
MEDSKRNLTNGTAESVGIQDETAPVHAQETPEVDEKQKTEMADSLKRAITLILWYKPNISPVRLNHHVPTFPLFQLSHFPQLITELGLTSSSYLDTYNDRTGQWEQHMITTVRTVDSEQRILYKVRKSLFDGLMDSECPGFAEEMSLQAKAQAQKTASTLLNQTNSVSNGGKVGKTKSGKKRPASDEQPLSSPPTKYHITDYGAQQQAQQQGYGVPPPPPPGGQGYPQNLSVPNGGGPPNPGMGQMPYPPYQPPPHYGPGPLMAMPPPYPAYPNHPGPHPPHQPPPPTSSSGAPFHSHTHPPAIKRWPNDYTVSEVTIGFAQMDGLMSQTPSITQRVAFERVFGTRYVKSTVCRHRGVWKRAGKGVGGLVGGAEREMWGDFVRRMEGRRGEAPKPHLVVGPTMDVAGGPGGLSHAQLYGGDPDGRVDGSPGDEEEEEEEVVDDEAVMGSLVPPGGGAGSAGVVEGQSG